MPAPNHQRRRTLADAAISLLAESGVHGVTHRAVERRAGLPTGTASNYFRSRDDLLVATTRRVLDLHRADMETAARAHLAVPRRDRGDRTAQLTDLLAGSLLAAAGAHRARYLAIFELGLESLRRPALATALAVLSEGSAAFTVDHHALLGLAVPPERVPLLLRLYGGALFSLVSGPPTEVTEATTRSLAAAIVAGALAGAPPAPE